MMEKQVIGIIPARYASSRFPGKPLAMIGDKTMIRRVYEQVSRVISQVVVATDDERIAAEVRSFGGDVCMTSASHRSGTDRCAEVIDQRVNESERSSLIVVNIQGDEPFIQPEQIGEILACFDQPDTEIATLARAAASLEEILDPNKPKVTVNSGQGALMFSRSPIPYLRNIARENWFGAFPFLIHVGMYAYRAEVLKAITRLSPSSLEEAESLEQLRWLENGYTIRVGFTNFVNRGIDTPADLEEILRSDLL